MVLDIWLIDFKTANASYWIHLQEVVERVGVQGSGAIEFAAFLKWSNLKVSVNFSTDSIPIDGCRVDF